MHPAQASPVARWRASCACDAVKIRCRRRRTRSSQARQSTACQSRTPSGPFTAPAGTAPNLSVGSNLVAIVSLTGSPDPRQPAFAAGHPARYPASYPRTPGRRARTSSPVSCCLSTTGIRFSGHPVPARGTGPSSRSADRPPEGGRTPSGFPRSALTSYDRVGCPLYPGDQRCSPDRMPCPASACHITAACPYTPPDHPTARSSVLRGIHKGSRDSPVRSAPHP